MRRCGDVLARASAMPLAAARSPPQPPLTPPQVSCTMHFASLFEESDDEAYDAPREAAGQQQPPPSRAGGGSLHVALPPLSARLAGAAPPALPFSAAAAAAAAAPHAPAVAAAAARCVARVVQLSSAHNAVELTLAGVAAEAAAQADAANSAQLATLIAAALRASGFSHAHAVGVEASPVAAVGTQRRSPPPNCAHMRSLLDRAGRHAYVAVAAGATARRYAAAACAGHIRKA